MTVHLVSDDGNKPVAAKAEGRRGLSLAGCFLLLSVLGWLDYITGYEMSFFVFYSVPVGIAAWYVGRWPAIGVALGATVSWLLADYFGGAKYSAPFFYYWNSTIHFLAFIINAVTIAKIKNDLDRRYALAAELEAAREALRAMSALLPACPACGKPRDAAEEDRETQLAALVRGSPEFAGTLCTECRNNGADAVPTTRAGSSAA
jgi:K+-sensing histidine kinase KdpD